MGPMRPKENAYPPPEFTAGDHCPECGNHFTQGHDAGCSQIRGKWGATAASRDFEANSPWSADYWLRRAVIEFEHDTDPGDWDRWNEHALHGTEEHEPQRHVHEPVLASRKQGWMGWGPDIANGAHHKVADWDWDNHLNAYVSTSSPRQFTCDCGDSHAVPDYFNCRCGKTWNSYIIGTGGDRHEAAAEKFLCREVPARDGVIVASRKTAEQPGASQGWDYDGQKFVHPMGFEVAPDERGYQLWAPTTSMGMGSGPLAKINRPSPDLQSHFDYIDRATGRGPKRRALNLDDLGTRGRGYDLDSEVENTTPWPTDHHPSAGEATMRPAPSDWHSRSQDGKWTSGGAPSAHQFKKKSLPG